MGNHDLATLVLWAQSNARDPLVHKMTPGLDERRIAAWHAEQLRVGLSDERVQQLRNLPTWTVAHDGVYAAHGAILSEDSADPVNISGASSYLRYGSPGCDLTLDTIRNLSSSADSLPWLVIVGHTHVPTLAHTAWKKPRQWRWRESIELPFNQSTPISLGDLDGQIVLLCPGSVGQPRQAGDDRRAAYAILDLEQRAVWFRRVEYNVGETLAAMVPPPQEILGLRQLLQDWLSSDR